MKNSPAMGFGMVQPKREGGPIAWDPGSPPRRRRKGEKRPVGSDYMELNIPKNWNRARVHKEVDEWLDQRSTGDMGSGFTKRRKRK